MAKKRFQRAEGVWRCEVTPEDGEKMVLTFFGYNSKRTEVRTSIVIDNYTAPDIIEGMMKVARRREQAAIDYVKRLKDAAQ